MRPFRGSLLGRRAGGASELVAGEHPIVGERADMSSGVGHLKQSPGVCDASEEGDYVSSRIAPRTAEAPPDREQADATTATIGFVNIDGQAGSWHNCLMGVAISAL
jgi:hypothetical protein